MAVWLAMMIFGRRLETLLGALWMRGSVRGMVEFFEGRVVVRCTERFLFEAGGMLDGMRRDMIVRENVVVW